MGTTAWWKKKLKHVKLLPARVGLTVFSFIKNFNKKITFARWQFNVLLLVAVTSGFFLSMYFVYGKFFRKAFAGDTPLSWTFTAASDYTLSDVNNIAISDNSAHLKYNEYTAAASTTALYHLNDNADDSSSTSPANSGTASNVTWTTGRLGNAGSFNGYSSQIVVPDASSLSFSQAHTLETWVKLNSTFDVTADRRQGLIDKGNYQLYFDPDTGRLNYELAPSSGNTWTQVAGAPASGTQSGIKGSWDLNGQQDVEAMVVNGTNVYVGLGRGTSDAEVWMWNSTNSSWTKIGGDALNNSWADETYEEVYTMVLGPSNNLYVGLGANNSDGEVWEWNGSTWRRVGGDGTGVSPSQYGWAGGAPGPYEYVTSLVYDGTTLYAGLGISSSDAEVWAWDGSQWSKIAGDGTGWPTGYEGVYSLTYNGTNVYAGLGNSANDADFYIYNGGTSWTKIGGDSANSGWTTNYETVQSVASDASNIYVGLGTTAGDAEVWRYTGGSWSRIGGDGDGTTPSQYGWNNSTYEAVYTLYVNGSDLYAGLGNSNGDGEIWVWNSGTSQWTKIAGDGVNSSWNNASSYTTVRSLGMIGNTLYAGVTQSTTTNIGTGEMWQFEGGSWSRIGGNYINNSWGYSGLNSVETLVQAGENLYAGTGTTIAAAGNVGDALVYKYDNSSWQMIGGQGVNGGWAPATYEIVPSSGELNGELYVGLGNSANDAEVWKWKDSQNDWDFIGGDGTGWGANYEQVSSMLAYNGYLYVGLGSSAGDAEVYRYNGSSWSARIGGDGTGASPSQYGWANNTYENVHSMSIFNNELYVGLGSSAGDAEVWKWNGSNSWTKMGGDGVNSSWNPTGNVTIGEVDSLVVYKGELYAGLGTNGGSGTAEVWKLNGSTWTLVGGDGTGDSPSQYGWVDLTYQRVRSMAVYNGELYASLGDVAGNGEVWKYDGTQWTKVGGDGTGWSGVVEYGTSLTVYKGKLYVGNGNTGNTDAAIWAYGNNLVLQSTQTSWDTNWHHIAATYDGSEMRLYVDSDSPQTLSAPDAYLSNVSTDLLIGSTAGERKISGAQGYFSGLMDEVRLSNTALTSFNVTPYTTTPQTVTPNSPLGVSDHLRQYDGFIYSGSSPNGSITFRLSSDNGTSWKYWNSGSWATSSSISQVNTQADINDNIASFPINPCRGGVSCGIKWQAVLTSSDGSSPITLNSVNISGVSDSTSPTAPHSITALSAASGGTAISSGNWYTHSAPYFSWSGQTDAEGSSNIDGFYVYLGVGASAVPSTSGIFQTGSSYTATALTNGQPMVSGQTYYLRIQTADVAGNTSSTYDAFTYKYDSDGPTNPTLINVSPTGFAPTNSFTFSWPAAGETGGASDGTGSGISGYQYLVGDSAPADAWSATITDNSVTLNDVAYRTGDQGNVFHLRAVDGTNTPASSDVSVYFYFAGEGPSAPQYLTVTPATNTANSFGFAWNPPANHSGEDSSLTYCYTINVDPSESSCTYTSPGATSLSAGPFATKYGTNTFHIVAKNSDDTGGAINYAAEATVTFSAYTSAPGIPLNADIADVSVKSTSSWKLALSWEAPADVGAGVDNYQIWSSLSPTSGFTMKASTTGIAFVDTGLTQETHYYKIRACDSVANCGSYSTVVSLLPTGKYTTAATLSSDPTVTSITTRKATINWATDRDSDSKIAYGNSSKEYFDEEPSNSDQVTDHSIALNNLSPGTTYYYVAKWTDEDGNTGKSKEFSFKTAPRPVISEVKVEDVRLTEAYIQFISQNASKIRIYYGPSSAFGAFKDTVIGTAKGSHTLELQGLQDGTKYFYKVNSFDIDGYEYEGDIYSFETLPRPKIDDVRIQQVKGTAQSAVLVSWVTNTEVSSIVTYYPEGNPGDARDEVNVKLVTGPHKILIKNLQPNTPYALVVKGRDKVGNEAASDIQRLTTATDTRPPLVTDLNTEGNVIVSRDKGVASAQLVVTWNTDEESTSQVEFGEGTGTTYSQKTQEDNSLTLNHMVMISGLSPSRVYHLRVISKDKANNEVKSVDTVTITPKASDDALNLVISNLSEVFGFLGGFKK